MSQSLPAGDDLSRIVVFGANYRDGSTDERERALSHVPDMFDRLDERLVLSTCHRVELIAVGDDIGGHVPAPLRVHRGRAAIERVLTVVAGLDSAIVAEEQLLGQVRDAYERGLSAGETGPILNELLRRALRVGRQARSMAGPIVDRSLADRALGGVGRPRDALVVGSGAMAERLAQGLSRLGGRLTIASRSPERAMALAVRHGGSGAAWDPSLVAPDRDVVAFATRVADPLLTAQDAMRIRDDATVVDLCAPSAVARDARLLLGERLIDLDTLGATAELRLDPRVQRRLEALVTDAADRFTAWLASRAWCDAITRLHAHAGDVRDRHIDRLRRGGRLSADQLRDVEAMTSGLLGELLHAATLHLRRGGEDADGVLDAYGLRR